MGSMRETVNTLAQTGMDGEVKVIIGGVPVTQSYADEIWADGYAPDAASAGDLAKKLIAG